MKPTTSETLSRIQLDVMEAVWAHGPEGVTVQELWQTLSRGRALARTTVLTMVVRLEKRGWLARTLDERPAHFRALRARDQAAGQLAGNFIDKFFGGSTAQLVMSLLGAKRLHPGEIARLRAMLAAPKSKEKDR